MARKRLEGPAGGAVIRLYCDIMPHSTILPNIFILSSAASLQSLDSLFLLMIWIGARKIKY